MRPRLERVIDYQTRRILAALPHPDQCPICGAVHGATPPGRRVCPTHGHVLKEWQRGSWDCPGHRCGYRVEVGP